MAKAPGKRGLYLLLVVSLLLQLAYIGTLVVVTRHPQQAIALYTNATDYTTFINWQALIFHLCISVAFLFLWLTVWGALRWDRAPLPGFRLPLGAFCMGLPLFIYPALRLFRQWQLTSYYLNGQLDETSYTAQGYLLQAFAMLESVSYVALGLLAVAGALVWYRAEYWPGESAE